MAKRYHVPIGRMADFPHPHPDRTAWKSGVGVFDDNVLQVWTSRVAMLKACEMSERGEYQNRWRPLVR